MFEEISSHSDWESYDAKKKEFDIITKYSKLGIQMSMPVEFGICNHDKNVYMLFNWGRAGFRDGVTAIAGGRKI